MVYVRPGSGYNRRSGVSSSGSGNEVAQCNSGWRGWDRVHWHDASGQARRGIARIPFASSEPPTISSDELLLPEPEDDIWEDSSVCVTCDSSWVANPKPPTRDQQCMLYPDEYWPDDVIPPGLVAHVGPGPDNRLLT